MVMFVGLYFKNWKDYSLTFLELTSYIDFSVWKKSSFALLYTNGHILKHHFQQLKDVDAIKNNSTKHG